MNQLGILLDDDFPLSPRGSQPAKEYFISFLESSQIYDSIPKKNRGDNDEATFYALLKQVHSERIRNPALYRRHFNANEALSTLWLSRIRSAARILTTLGAVPPFEGLSEDALADIGKWSAKAENLSSISSRLLKLGIILVYERAVPGMKLDGAAFLLESGNPVIALTLRYPRLDNYWFTLMHELSHVVLHCEFLQTPIMDDLDENPTSVIEKQADRLAAASLISRSDWRSCPAKYDTNPTKVNAFARQVGVHPAIVAGRLRKEMDRYDLFSDIVTEIHTRKVLLDDE